MMKAKLSQKTIKSIRADRKMGMTIGELSWKYNLTITAIMKICERR
jgi:Mor family transcriptional regulator